MVKQAGRSQKPGINLPGGMCGRSEEDPGILPLPLEADCLLDEVAEGIVLAKGPAVAKPKIGSALETGFAFTEAS